MADDRAPPVELGEPIPSATGPTFVLGPNPSSELSLSQAASAAVSAAAARALAAAAATPEPFSASHPPPPPLLVPTDAPSPQAPSSAAESTSATETAVAPPAPAPGEAPPPSLLATASDADALPAADTSSSADLPEPIVEATDDDLDRLIEQEARLSMELPSTADAIRRTLQRPGPSSPSQPSPPPPPPPQQQQLSNGSPSAALQPLVMGVVAGSQGAEALVGQIVERVVDEIRRIMRPADPPGRSNRGRDGAPGRPYLTFDDGRRRHRSRSMERERSVRQSGPSQGYTRPIANAMASYGARQAAGTRASLQAPLSRGRPSGQGNNDAGSYRRARTPEPPRNRRAPSPDAPSRRDQMATPASLPPNRRRSNPLGMSTPSHPVQRSPALAAAANARLSTQSPIWDRLAAPRPQQPSPWIRGPASASSKALSRSGELQGNPGGTPDAHAQRARTTRPTPSASGRSPSPGPQYVTPSRSSSIKPPSPGSGGKGSLAKTPSGYSVLTKTQQENERELAAMRAAELERRKFNAERQKGNKNPPEDVMASIEQLDFLDSALDQLLVGSAAKPSARGPLAAKGKFAAAVVAPPSPPKESVAEAEAFIEEIAAHNAEMEAKVSRELARIERDRRVAQEVANESKALDEFILLEKATCHQTLELAEPDELDG